MSNAAGSSVCSRLPAPRSLLGSMGILPLTLRSVSDQLKNHCHHSLTCLQTLRSMDSMLRAIVLSSPPSRISEELQNILQVWAVQGMGVPGLPEGEVLPTCG